VQFTKAPPINFALTIWLGESDNPIQSLRGEVNIILGIGSQDYNEATLEKGWKHEPGIVTTYPDRSSWPIGRAFRNEGGGP